MVAGYGVFNCVKGGVRSKTLDVNIGHSYYKAKHKKKEAKPPLIF